MYAATLEAASPRQRERALVERHRAGDPTAFDDLYREVSELVYNVTLRQCGDRDLAYDLSQEIFVRIFKGLGRFRCQSSLKTWVYRVALNHCHSRFARKRIQTVSLQPTDQDEDRALDPSDPRRNPEQDALQDDRQQRIARALSKVDRAYRESVVLRDLEELSYQEIAEVLAVPVGTVRSRIARGRVQLRQALERQK